MNLQFGQTGTAGSEIGLGKQLGAALCGVAVSMAVLAGIGTRQTTGQSSKTMAGSTTGLARTTATAGQAVSPVRGAYDGMLTYYLVDSQEQADVVESRLQEEAANPLVAAGKALKYEVVIATPEDETVLRQAVASENYYAGAYDQSGPQLIDLRQPVSDSTTATAPVRSDQAHGYTFYLPSSYLLVDSEEEASLIQEHIRGGESQFANGLVVRVVRSPEEELAFRGSIGATATVIDLRPLEGMRDDAFAG